MVFCDDSCPPVDTCSDCPFPYDDECTVWYNGGDKTCSSSDGRSIECEPDCLTACFYDPCPSGVDDTCYDNYLDASWKHCFAEEYAPSVDPITSETYPGTITVSILCEPDCPDPSICYDNPCLSTDYGCIVESDGSQRCLN